MSGKPRRKVSAPSGPVSSVLSGLFHFQRTTPVPPQSGHVGGGVGTSATSPLPPRRRWARQSDASSLTGAAAAAAAAASAGDVGDDATSGRSGSSDEAQLEKDDDVEQVQQQSGRLLGKPPIHRSQSTGDSRAVVAAAAAATASKGPSVGSCASNSSSSRQRYKKHQEAGADSFCASGGSNSGVYEGGDDHRLSSCDLSRRKKKSIGEKFSFLSWKNQTGSGGVGHVADLFTASSSSVRPTHDQVVRWGSSFDSLLNDKYGLALFRAFLKTEYSDENIEFWVACEEFRSLAGPKKQAAKAQKIYNEFVAFQAPREVNLDSTTRLTTINSMGSIDKHLFEQAQKRIQALMEKDSYQRFLRSEVYLSHLNSGGGVRSRDHQYHQAAAPSSQAGKND